MKPDIRASILPTVLLVILTTSTSLADPPPDPNSLVPQIPRKVFVVSTASRNVQSSPVELTISGETDQFTQMAVVVRDANQPDAKDFRPYRLENLPWEKFQPKFSVNLGPKDGLREVWVGVVDESNKQMWQRVRVTVDSQPPKITVTHPETALVTEPVIQVQGFVKKELRSVSCHIENAFGKRDVPVQITDREFDREARVTSKTYFQCFDLRLASGTNVITLTVTDMAGNTATEVFPYILDVSADTTPPELEVQWPKMLDEIFSRELRVRGRVNEPNAKVSVVGLTPEPVVGQVERDGQFWVPGLPLKEGLNTFTVVAEDPAGNPASETVSVIRSPVEIVIDPPTDDEKKKKRPTITGTISHSGYSVWVNGVKAVLQGNRWTAPQIPLNPQTGTAIIQAIAIPNDINGGNGFGGPRKPSVQDMGNPSKVKSN